MCLSLLLVAPFLLALPAGGQDTTGPLVSQSSGRLVNVNVAVRGLNGEPLAGLAKSNFHLFDNGEPETISVFAGESKTRDASDSAGDPTGLANLGPDVFSNRIDTGAHPPSSATIILLDMLNTTGVHDPNYARGQLIHFLKQLKPRDRVGLYSLGAGLHVFHDFTTDASGLLAGLDKYSSGASADALGLASIFSPEGNTFERTYSPKDRFEATTRAIEFIAEHTISLPGRKNLIWVSGEFPLTIGYGAADDRFDAEYSPELKHCVAAVSAAGLAIYPADAQVLLNATRPSPAKVDGGMDRKQRMGLIAARTGGRAFVDRKDLDHAIEQTIADSEGSYTLGFYPRHRNFDGAFRKLNIVLDAPHSNLRYRDGYFAFAKPRQDRKTRETDMKVAATSPIDANWVSLTAQVLPGRKANKPAGPSALQVTVQINPKTISLAPKGAIQAGQLDALFVQHDAVGRPLDFETKFIGLKLSATELAKVRRFGILFRQDVVRAKDAESLRVVVRDVNSGVMGSLTIPYRQLSSQ